MSPNIELTMSFPLRAMHRLKTNAEDEPLHGHNYKIEIALGGELDTEAEWLYSRDLVDKIVRELVLDRFDKTYLNDILDKTSGEYLAKTFFEILKKSDMGPRLRRLALQETRKNRFVCYG